jgi:hypothetical protein
MKKLRPSLTAIIPTKTNSRLIDVVDGIKTKDGRQR